MNPDAKLELNPPSDIREALAAYAHDAWSGWMKYLFSKCREFSGSPGALVIPKWAVKRWKRQAGTLYADLPEDEKPSDRKEAERMLEIVRAASHDSPGDIKEALEGLEGFVEWVHDIPGEVIDVDNETAVAKKRLSTVRAALESRLVEGEIGEALEELKAFIRAVDLIDDKNRIRALTHLSTVREWVGESVSVHEGWKELNVVAKDKIARLGIELGETHLVLESQDRRLHRHRSALEEARDFMRSTALSWPAASAKTLHTQADFIDAALKDETKDPG